MKIQKMFKDDINRPINGVVQVEQDTERVLIQELDEYVPSRYSLELNDIIFLGTWISLSNFPLPKDLLSLSFS